MTGTVGITRLKQQEMRDAVRDGHAQEATTFSNRATSRRRPPPPEPVPEVGLAEFVRETPGSYGRGLFELTSYL